MNHLLIPPLLALDVVIWARVLREIARVVLA